MAWYGKTFCISFDTKSVFSGITIKSNISVGVSFSMDIKSNNNIYYRKKWGRGFQYFDANQQKVTCRKLLKHFGRLVIPPMWKEVEIVADTKAKIQATGRDAKNRKQYIYNETWQKKQQQKKFRQMLKFADKLPHMRQHCYSLLDEFDSSREHVLALMLLILDETGIRIGNQRYTQQNQTFGLSTLRRKHVMHTDDALVFEFTGKSKQARTVMIEDEALIEHIRKCVESPGFNIFRFKQSSSQWQNLCSDDVNTYIRAIMGKDFSAKDFRTWHASCLAVEAYLELYPFEESKAKPLNQVVKHVSMQLGNTMKICKEYYIHPKILKLIEKNNFHKRLVKDLETQQYPQHSDAIERATLELMSKRA
jgi:DNA topoisomerase-1